MKHDTLMTPSEVSKYLRVSRWKLRQLISDGKITVIKIGGRYRIEWEQIERWLENGGTLNDK